MSGVFLNLEGRDDDMPLNTDKESFWNDTCRELISKEIGIWLINNGKAPWPKGRPSRLRLEPVG